MADYQTNYEAYCAGEDCAPLNMTAFILNTTNSSACVTVFVSCTPQYQLVPSSHVYVCTSGMWMPLAPQCVAIVYESDIGVIIGCTLGAFVCLLIVAMAIYMLLRSGRKEKEMLEREQERERSHDVKMQRIRDYVAATTQDDARSTFDDDVTVPPDDDVTVPPDLPDERVPDATTHPQGKGFTIGEDDTTPHTYSQAVSEI